MLFGLCCNLEGDVATEKGVSGATSMAANVGYCGRTDSRPAERMEGKAKADAENGEPLDAAALYYSMTDHADETSGLQEDGGSSSQPGA